MRTYKTYTKPNQTRPVSIQNKTKPNFMVEKKTISILYNTRAGLVFYRCDSTFPCQWVGKWVSEQLIVSDFGYSYCIYRVSKTLIFAHLL